VKTKPFGGGNKTIHRLLTGSRNCVCFIIYYTSLAVQCIVIGPVCGFVAVFVWGVCYHDNSKFRASIFTKLGL